MTYYDLLACPSFFQMLTIFDRDLADHVHTTECCRCCGGKLDRANYLRSGYGMPADATDDVKRRFSFCCRQCRARRTPDSLRFLEGKAYPGAIVTLLAVLQHGETAARQAALSKVLGVDRRTLGRWRRWWRDHFATSPLWRGARGLLPLAGVDLPLPAQLLEAFGAGRELLDSLLAVARFLAPWRRPRPK
jgi:hypothetical protein